MKELLIIDLKKLTRNRSFIILLGLYFFSLGITMGSGMEFLKYLKSKGVEFDEWDPTMIPIYHFPDIWHNLTYYALNFRFILALVVIISVANEFQFRTIRQNIIDGFSRWDFVKSKVATIVLLSLASTLFVFIIGLITGLIYSPYREFDEMLEYIAFIPAYFLELAGFMVFTMFITILIRRSVLTMGVLFLYTVILEPILRWRIDVEFINSLLPANAFSNLIQVPYQRYIFMEIQDYVPWDATLIALGYTALFVYLSHLLLVKRDI